jgi:hypothetical protein
MGVEGAGGGFIGERYARWCSGCGVVVMEQVPRGSRCDGGEGGLFPAMMAAVGALQRGRGVVVMRMEVGYACGGGHG